MTFEEKIEALFNSRRFYAAAITLLAVFFTEWTGISEEEMQVLTNAVYIIGAWIIGDSINKTKIEGIDTRTAKDI